MWKEKPEGGDTAETYPTISSRRSPLHQPARDRRVLEELHVSHEWIIPDGVYHIQAMALEKGFSGYPKTFFAVVCFIMHDETHGRAIGLVGGTDSGSRAQSLWWQATC